MSNANPYFVAKDVCEALGIEKHRDAISRLDDDERGSVLVDTLGGRQEMAFNRNAGKYVSTDRLVIITDDGIQDTGDI